MPSSRCDWLLRKSKCCSSRGDQDLIVHDLGIMATCFVGAESSRVDRASGGFCVCQPVPLAVSQRVQQAIEEASRSVKTISVASVWKDWSQSPWFWYAWGDIMIIILERRWEGGGGIEGKIDRVPFCFSPPLSIRDREGKAWRLGAQQRIHSNLLVPTSVHCFVSRSRVGREMLVLKWKEGRGRKKTRKVFGGSFF